MSVRVRDLDYVNPRHRFPSCALPPEVRSALGLVQPDESDDLLAASTAIQQSLVHSANGREWPVALAIALQPIARKSSDLRALLERHSWTGEKFVHEPNREQLLEQIKQQQRQARISSGQPLRKSCSEIGFPTSSGLQERFARGGQSEELYLGSANVTLVASGSAGAGSDWANPYGHAYVRRGTAQQRLASLQEHAKERRGILSSSVSRSRML